MIHFIKTSFLLCIGIQSTCLALPAGTNQHLMEKSSTLDKGESSSTYHQGLGEERKVPPLSSYTVNQDRVGYKQIHNPDWNAYSFHMINDHPINAQLHRNSLDEDLKDGTIDNILHKKLVDNSIEREKAVKHILNDGIVSDKKSKVVIHRGKDAETLARNKKEEHFADLYTMEVSNKACTDIHVFESPLAHTIHQDKERYRQQSRINEQSTMKRQPGIGKQRDIDRWSSVQYPVNDGDEGSTPPPSPPSRSASPPPQEDGAADHKRRKLGEYHYYAAR